MEAVVITYFFLISPKHGTGDIAQVVSARCTNVKLNSQNPLKAGLNSTHLLGQDGKQEKENIQKPSVELAWYNAASNEVETLP